MRESAVEKYLKQVVEKRLGGECLKFTSPGRRHVTDRIVILPGGEVWFIETKAPGKTPRPGQVRFAKRLKELGALHATLDSKSKIEDWAVAPVEEGWRNLL